MTETLASWGCWDDSWATPASGGLTQARKRLGPEPLELLFGRVAVPVAGELTAGRSCASGGAWGIAARAAMIYLHTTGDRQRQIADARGDLARTELASSQKSRRGGKASGTNWHSPVGSLLGDSEAFGLAGC